MGIADIREQLKDLPGAANLTMSYEDGGKVQAFQIGDKVARVGADATAADIRQALLAPDVVAEPGAGEISVPSSDLLAKVSSLIASMVADGLSSDEIAQAVIVAVRAG